MRCTNKALPSTFAISARNVAITKTEWGGGGGGCHLGGIILPPSPLPYIDQSLLSMIW